MEASEFGDAFVGARFLDHVPASLEGFVDDRRKPLDLGAQRRFDIEAPFDGVIHAAKCRLRHAAPRSRLLPLGSSEECTPWSQLKCDACRSRPDLPRVIFERPRAREKGPGVTGWVCGAIDPVLEFGAGREGRRKSGNRAMTTTPCPERRILVLRLARPRWPIPDARERTDVQTNRRALRTRAHTHADVQAKRSDTTHAHAGAVAHARKCSQMLHWHALGGAPHFPPNVHLTFVSRVSLCCPFPLSRFVSRGKGGRAFC